MNPGQSTGSDNQYPGWAGNNQPPPNYAGQGERPLRPQAQFPTSSQYTFGNRPVTPMYSGSGAMGGAPYHPSMPGSASSMGTMVPNSILMPGTPSYYGGYNQYHERSLHQGVRPVTHVSAQPFMPGAGASMPMYPGEQSRNAPPVVMPLSQSPASMLTFHPNQRERLQQNQHQYRQLQMQQQKQRQQQQQQQQSIPEPLNQQPLRPVENTSPAPEREGINPHQHKYDANASSYG